MTPSREPTGRFAGLRLPVLILLVATLLACGVSGAPTATAVPAATATATATTPPTAAVAPTASPTTVAASPTARSTVTRAQGIDVTPIPAGPAPAFVDVRAAIVAYLQQSGGSVDGLSAAIGKWGMASQAQSGEGFLPAKPPAVAADFDGDGQDEVAVVAEDPESTSVVGSSIVLIVDSTAGEYAIAYDAATPEYSTGAAALLSVADADGDSVADLSYTVVSCGAHTCYYEVDVISHRGGQYANVSPGVSVPYPDMIALRNEQGDKRLEIVIHGGTIGSVGAGPQRTSTLIYAFDDGAYSLAEVEYDPSDLLYFRIVDANAALAAGDTADAIALYEQARDDRGLKASGLMLNGMTEAQEDEALRSFARFRLVVAETIAGDEAAAQAALDDAVAHGGPYAPLAAAYWQAYSPSAAITTGCAAVEDAATQSSDPVDILNAFGYANPYFTAADVCRTAGIPQ